MSREVCDFYNSLHDRKPPLEVEKQIIYKWFNSDFINNYHLIKTRWQCFKTSSGMSMHDVLCYSFSLFTQFTGDYLNRTSARKSDLALYLHFTYFQAFQLSHLCRVWKSHLTAWIPIWVRSETSHQSRGHLFTPRQATELWLRVTQHRQTRQLIPSEKVGLVG